MNSPFQSTLDPYGSQYGMPSATAYGSGDQNPNPNPVSASASNPLGWANMNTYAPWTTPDGSTGSNPSFSGSGSWGYIGNQPGYYGSQGSGQFGLGGSLLGLGKKYNLPDISAPSYQGTLFNPGGNYLSSIGFSPEGQAQMSQSQSTPTPQTYQPQYQGGSSPYGGGQFQGASGLQSSQSFVGQSPYGVAGGTYVPGQGQTSASYGGYGNYGGYANSNAGMYVPGQ